MKDSIGRSNATNPSSESLSGPLTLKETDYHIIRDILKKLIDQERTLDHGED